MPIDFEHTVEEHPYQGVEKEKAPLEMVTFSGLRQSGRSYSAIEHAIETANVTHDPIVVFKTYPAYEIVADICEKLDMDKTTFTMKQVTKGLSEHNESYRDAVVDAVNRQDFIAVIDAEVMDLATLNAFVALYRDWLVAVAVVLPDEHDVSPKALTGVITDYKETLCSVQQRLNTDA